MNECSNNVLYASPALRDGKLYRGVAATDGVRRLLPLIDRSRWVLLYLSHGATLPWHDPEYDLYQTDPCYADAAPGPRVYVTPRDFTKPDEFRPLGLAKEFDIAFVSTWRHLKRPGLLVDALTHARDCGRPISCLWFGYHWHPEGADLERATVAEVEARRLPVTFAPTDFDRREVNRRFNLARAAVLCSETEAGPRVMSEAMLADLPYITTRDTLGGSPAWVNDQNGRTCDPTPEALARAIWHVLDQAQTYRPRAWALENMCLPVALRRLRAAIEELAGPKGWDVNVEDLSYARIDWQGSHGDVQRADALGRP